MRRWGRDAAVAATVGFAVVCGMAMASSCGDGRAAFGPADASSEEAPGVSWLEAAPPPPPRPYDAAIPFVACPADEPDAAVESGASDGDAAAQVDASICASPPLPRCIASDSLATYGAGPCDAGECSFGVEVFHCDCVQVRDDGGDFCSSIAGK